MNAERDLRLRWAAGILAVAAVVLIGSMAATHLHDWLRILNAGFAPVIIVGLLLSWAYQQRRAKRLREEQDAALAEVANALDHARLVETIFQKLQKRTGVLRDTDFGESAVSPPSDAPTIH